MIARSNREALRQAALAERRKAIFERISQPKVIKAINEVGDVAAEMYTQGGEERMKNLLPEDGTAILTPVVNDIYQLVINTLGKEAKGDLKCWTPTMELKATDDSIDVVTQNLLNIFGQYAFEQSTIMASTLTDESIAAVAQYLSQDSDIIDRGPRAVAIEIRKTARTLAPWKAEMIARTEIQMAYNEAQSDFTEELWDPSEDGQLYKKWFSTRDRRVRDSHKKLNGRVVRQDEVFETSNKDELRYPGDRKARKLESIINCRCSYSSIPEELVPKRQRRG